MSQGLVVFGLRRWQALHRPITSAALIAPFRMLAAAEKMFMRGLQDSGISPVTGEGTEGNVCAEGAQVLYLAKSL